MSDSRRLFNVWGEWDNFFLLPKLLDRKAHPAITGGLSLIYAFKFWLTCYG